LSTVDGTPTTFDFKGLSIDVGSLITDWSNRGNYKEHQKDFRLLWGLQASYYEGQLFDDVAGLRGISTVKGLQYAYANPSDYTVYTITSANESVIDTLALSENTKQNMRTDVQAGNTILTPNTFVSDGVWRGILYVSLDPKWTGTYAIGEQTGENGGWTMNLFTLSDWDDADAHHQYAYEYDNGPQRIIYKDNTDKNILCKIFVTTYNQIVGGNIAPGWSLAQYGKPCVDDNENGPYMFGAHDHRFIVATDGAYFKSVSDDYDYWITNKNIHNKFFFKFPGSYNGWGRLIPYYGTYANNDTANDRILMYYPKINEVFSVEEKMYRRYTSNQKVLDVYLPGLLGFPTTDKKPATPYSSDNTSGFYQQFTNGTLYLVDNWFIDDVYPVIGKINEKHNELGGSGTVGFPIIDPTPSGQGLGVYFQNFQDGQKLRYNGSIVEVSDASQTLSVNRNYEAEEYDELREGIFDAFYELDLYGFGVNIAGGIGTSQIIKKGIAFAVEKGGKKALVKVGVRFIPYVGWTIAGASVSLAALENKPLYNACNADPESRIEDKRPAYYCGKLAVNAAMFGAGIGVDVVATKLNWLGVGSKLAQKAKVRATNMVDNDAEWLLLKKNTYLSPKTRTNFYERIGKLNLNDDEVKTIVSNPKAVKLLFSPEYYAWENWYGGKSRAMANLAAVNKDLLDTETLIHSRLGKFHPATGLFTGDGLHSAETLIEATDKGVVEVFEKGINGRPIKDIRTFLNSNANTEVKISQRTGSARLKTILPSAWTIEDEISAVRQASKFRTDDHFSGLATVKGITVKVSGSFYKDVGKTNLVKNYFGGDWSIDGN